MTTLCTLFDHNYLDKGIVMYESLEKVCDEFVLYVLCMSDKCFEILTDLNYQNLIPIKLEDFEDEELLRVKPFRAVGEYCWTCSPSLIRYVLMTFNPKYCAYIDADLYFYSDPKVVVEEMQRKGASVQITGHRFNDDVAADECWRVGKYCVEYNTFKNDINGLKLLNLWRKQCLEHCSLDGDGVYFGDQKYMDNWCDDYDFVIETENLGMGVAPWNINQYKLTNVHPNIVLNCKGRDWNLVFYHFQSITYLDKYHMRMSLSKQDRNTIEVARPLYIDYLRKIDKVKDLILAKYGILNIMKKHPGVNTGGNTIFTKILNVLKKPILIVHRYSPFCIRKLVQPDLISIK